MATQALMKRGKRPVAKLFKDECNKPASHQQLNDLLDFILDPNQKIEEFERIDWCKWIIAGGKTFEEFKKEVLQYNYSITCGLVWTANYVAYRCRTCGISPCMSLCAECFQAGEHTGHDFNMFRSQAGGACDCGSVGVMKDLGFCPHHGPEQAKKQTVVPPDLLLVANFMMPKLLLRLVSMLRENANPKVRIPVPSDGLLSFIEFLITLFDLGAAIRSTIAQSITSPDVYASLNNVPPNKKNSSYMSLIKYNYEDALAKMTGPPNHPDFEDITQLSAPLVHNSILEELLFWTIKYEFPQALVTLLLSALPEDTNKEAFTRTFVMHYSRIAVSLVAMARRSDEERNHFSSRVVHISVQLISPEELSIQMIQLNIMHVMLLCLHWMMRSIVTDSDINDQSDNTHRVVECSRPALKGHIYWPIVSDLINLLSHKPIAYRFMEDQRILKLWFEIVSMFQGMNCNHRELLLHVEFEPDTYYAAFSAELEICASPMWSTLVHCTDESSFKYSKAMIDAATKALKDWFDSTKTNPHKHHPLQMSFHLPLHRHLAVFLSQAVRNQGQKLNVIFDVPHSFIHNLMLHPMKLLISFHEIFANMWARNGLQMKGQAMTYVQNHFCNSMVDADLYLLQVCATKLDPDHFVTTLLDRAHVMETLSFVPYDQRLSNPYVEVEQQNPMLEGALTMLVMILAVRTNLGMTEEELTRLEMVTLLAMSDHTHSQLSDSLPEKCGLVGQDKDFEPVLKEVADYVAPAFEAGGAMQQGMYVPKPKIWEDEFDPIYVMLRGIHKKDFQQTIDRYTAYLRQANKWPGVAAPWPPFRIPGPTLPSYHGIQNLLHCRTMHALILTILHKALNEEKFSDTALYLIIFLLEMAVTLPASRTNHQMNDSAHVPKDKVFSEFYKSDDIFTNLYHVIEEMEIVVEDLDGESSRDTPQTPSSDMPSTSYTAVETPDGTAMQMQPTNQVILAARPPSNPNDGQNQTNHLVQLDMVNTVQMDLIIVNGIAALLNQATANLTGLSNVQLAQRQRQFRNRGVNTNTYRKSKVEITKVGESIVTLLLKLHNKFSGANALSYIPVDKRSRPSTSMRSGSPARKNSKLFNRSSNMSDDSQADMYPQGTTRIGDGAFFIGQVLDKICSKNEICAQIVTEHYNRNIPLDIDMTKGKGKSAKEEKKRKAKERQQKLIEIFESKQKKFLEKIQSNSSIDSNFGNSSGYSDEFLEETFDCSICSQTTTSTMENPFCLVVLLQPTSVLGHRRLPDDNLIIPSEPAGLYNRPHITCATEANKRLRLLMQHFNEASSLLSISMGWEGGVYVHTCGHMIHLNCHKSYLESLNNQDLLYQKGEYNCPVCRQLSNTILPILPQETNALSRPIPTKKQEMVLMITEMLSKRHIIRGNPELTEAMKSVMDDLISITNKKYSHYIDGPSSENVLLFVNSVFRTNLELRILQHGGNLSKKSLKPHKKSCLVPLLNVLSMHNKILSSQPAFTLWGQLTGISINTTPSSSLEVYENPVPLLLRDPVATFLSLILDMPHTMEQSYFLTIVRVMYNLTFIQAMAMMSCKFTDEERIAWQTKPKTPNYKSIMGLMAAVIRELSDSTIFDEGSSVDPHVPAICQTVWSPQSVEQNVQNNCIHFLRIASMLFHHLYHHALPIAPEKDIDKEFEHLCVYLNLVGKDTSTADSEFYSSSAVHWYTPEPQSLIHDWCHQLKLFAKSRSMQARAYSSRSNKSPVNAGKVIQRLWRTLLIVNHGWQTPKLCILPQNYDIIFQHYRKVKCKRCNEEPSEPALCLVCGALICFKGACCKAEDSKQYECVFHSVQCGAGTGIFLIINSSVIVIIQGSRAVLWGSVYLDDHGEEDRDLKRGRPLYLSKERYDILHQQWLNHTFHTVNRRWIFHHDHL